MREHCVAGVPAAGEGQRGLDQAGQQRDCFPLPAFGGEAEDADGAVHGR
jgi:hypothetical protein